MTTGKAPIPSEPRGMLVGADASRSGSSSTYVYLQGIPQSLAYAAEHSLEWSRPALSSASPAVKAVAIARHGRAAGCVGVQFVPDQTAAVLRLNIAVSSACSESAYVPGLPPWAATAVLAGLRRAECFGTVPELGAGFLRVQWGWWHQINSSEWGFGDLGERLLPLLLLPSASGQDEISAAWYAQRY